MKKPTAAQAKLIKAIQKKLQNPELTPEEKEILIQSLNDIEATAPEVTQPQAPEVTQPEAPEVTQPEAPEVTQPEAPEVTQPEAPEVTQPGSQKNLFSEFEKEISLNEISEKANTAKASKAAKQQHQEQQQKQEEPEVIEVTGEASETPKKDGRGRPRKQTTATPPEKLQKAVQVNEEAEILISGALLNMFTFRIIPKAAEKLTKGRLKFDEIDLTAYPEIEGIADKVAANISIFKNPLVAYGIISVIILWSNVKN